MQMQILRGSANIGAELRERESELVRFDIGVSKKIEGYRLTAIFSQPKSTSFLTILSCDVSKDSIVPCCRLRLT
jgi:hypothetical protein